MTKVIGLVLGWRPLSRWRQAMRPALRHPRSRTSRPPAAHHRLRRRAADHGADDSRWRCDLASAPDCDGKRRRQPRQAQSRARRAIGTNAAGRRSRARRDRCGIRQRRPARRGAVPAQRDQQRCSPRPRAENLGPAADIGALSRRCLRLGAQHVGATADPRDQYPQSPRLCDAARSRRSRHDHQRPGAQPVERRPDDLSRAPLERYRRTLPRHCLGGDPSRLFREFLPRRLDRARQRHCFVAHGRRAGRALSRRPSQYQSCARQLTAGR